jgi:CitMHS family citrate-Mg2+:H+ or citrate-Ca2+:H+ symporter
MYLPLVGYVLMFFIILFLLKGKMSPVVVMILLPFLAALCLGHAPAEIAGFIRKGVGTTMNTAILLFFSVIFFSVMSELGVFDVIVNQLIKRAGANIVAITGVTSVVAIIAHLDGATATTVLITIPAMWPIYQRLRIRPHVLLCITTSTMGFMNLVPWGGPTARVASVLKMDATLLWHQLIPIQVVGAVLTVAMAIVLGIIEQRRISASAGQSPQGEAESLTRTQTDAAAQAAKELEPRQKMMLWVNSLLTLAVILILVFDLMAAYVVFMLALSIALLLNYRTLKEQDSQIKAHAPAAFIIGAVIIAAGALVGVLDATGMMKAMTEVLIGIVPKAFGGVIHLVFGVLALPLGIVVGTDAYFFGIFPLVAGVGEQFGVSPLQTGLTMLIGKNVGLMLSPLVPATWLALGLVDMEVKDHIKFSFLWLFGTSLLLLLAGIVMGIIKV